MEPGHGTDPASLCCSLTAPGVAALQRARQQRPARLSSATAVAPAAAAAAPLHFYRLDSSTASHSACAGSLPSCARARLPSPARARACPSPAQRLLGESAPRRRGGAFQLKALQVRCALL